MTEMTSSVHDLPPGCTSTLNAGCMFCFIEQRAVLTLLRRRSCFYLQFVVVVFGRNRNVQRTCHLRLDSGLDSMHINAYIRVAAAQTSGDKKSVYFTIFSNSTAMYIKSSQQYTAEDCGNTVFRKGVAGILENSNDTLGRTTRLFVPVIRSPAFPNNEGATDSTGQGARQVCLQRCFASRTSVCSEIDARCRRRSAELH